jgi:large subunit ribosomal protein L19e
MNLTGQKKIAARLLKVGVKRVQFDPERLEEISEALTRDDIRYLISSGAIKARRVKGVSRGRVRDRRERKAEGRSRGHGSRSGTAKARSKGKRRWVDRIRAIRDELRKMRDEGKINKTLYRRLYRQANGNVFQSRRHLREHVERLSKQ